MPDSDPDWLGDMRWRGYPHLEPKRDVASAAASSAPAREKAAPPAEPDPRLEQLARENESLRARLDALLRTAAEFERRISETATSYEAAVLEAESKLRDAALERERLAGELESTRGEAARAGTRDSAREADLRLERKRRADAEKALLEARRKLEELLPESERLRATASEQAGTIAELRRQSAAQTDRLLQAKALTDEDVRLLRQEMKEFLAKLHRMQESSGENK